MQQVINLEDAHATYQIVMYMGRATQCLRTPKGDDLASPVDWEDLPFLVQARVQAESEQQRDGLRRL